MELKLLEWLAQYGTLATAVLGAVTGIGGLSLSILNRRDAVAKNRREEAAETPWATLHLTKGTTTCFPVRVTFHNPGTTRYVVTSVEVIRPKKMIATMLQTPRRGALVDKNLDWERSGRTVEVEWPIGFSDKSDRRFLAAATDFVVSVPGAASLESAQSGGGSKEHQIAVEIRFKASSVPAIRAPITLTAKATAMLVAAP